MTFGILKNANKKKKTYGTELESIMLFVQTKIKAFLTKM